MVVLPILDPNNTIYGLGGSVWTESLPLALEAALSIKAGTVWINSHNLFDSAAGFGGYKQAVLNGSTTNTGPNIWRRK
jgi:acyl-CoA reductase-like NAD-dependent aldehyde dehydrogenase